MTRVYKQDIRQRFLTRGTYTDGRVLCLAAKVTTISMNPCFVRMRSQVHAVFPMADVPSVVATLLLQDGVEGFLESPMVYENRLRGLLRLSVVSLTQLLQRILASTFLTHPLEPSIEMISDRFLSAPLSFTIDNAHIVDIFRQMKWCIFGNLSRYLNFDMSSITYITRCGDLLSTHVLFQYISPTAGFLHILPDCIRPNVRGDFEKYSMDAVLPFEYTFKHDLYHEHHNYRYSQLAKQMSPVDRILGHATYPIGRTMGTFYRAAGGNVVLVSPSVSAIGYVLSDTELEQIEELRCSLVDLAPGEDLCHTVILPVMRGLANPDSRPSYLVVPDRDIPQWADAARHLHLVSFSDLNQVTWTETHLVVIDNAHLLKTPLPPHRCRHLICLSAASMPNLIHLCGIQKLPFVPLEPARDLCVFQERSRENVPCPILIDPDPGVHLIHKQPYVQDDHLLRVCAGGSIPRMTQVNGVVMSDAICLGTPFGSPFDPCMVCLSAVMVDPVVLPCRHILCKSCVQEIALCSSVAPRCPCCRALVDRPTTRPVWDGDRHTLTIVCKQEAVSQYVRSFVGTLCIITAHPDIAQTYATMLTDQNVRTCLYVGTTRPTNERVVVCSFGAYDRHIHRYCTDILVSDIGRDDIRGLTKVLYDRHGHVKVFLMRGGADEILFRCWYPVI